MATKKVAAEKKVKKKVGAPSKYTPELAERICDAIATTPKGLKSICAENEGFPSSKVVLEWVSKNKSFRDKYLLAKSMQSHAIIESIDEVLSEKHTYIDGEGNQRIDPGHVAWQRLRANEWHWQAARLNPHVYAERIAKEKENENTEEIQKQIIELQNKLLKANEKEY